MTTQHTSGPEIILAWRDGVLYHGNGRDPIAVGSLETFTTAPKLLEALKLLVYRYECRDDGDVVGPEDIKEANAAIAKAEVTS